MTENAIFIATTAPLTIAVLVLPQASILEVASTLDPLRNANRQLGYAAFRWKVVSPDGGPVPLTCGLSLPADGRPADAVGAEALIVIAGYRLEEAATRPLIRELRRIAPRFALVGGVDAGPWVLARAGLLDGYRATVHWEDLEDLADRHPRIEVLPDRFVIDRNRVTIAGAAPAADFMLHLIRMRHGARLAREVANSFITHARPGAEPQITPHRREGGMETRVAKALARMEARIDQPESAAQTAAALGLSARRLETLFRHALGTTPGAYALSLRLQAARRMIAETRHPLSEIAIRTGFSGTSALSRAFSNLFGHSPSLLRKGKNSPEIPKPPEPAAGAAPE